MNPSVHTDDARFLQLLERWLSGDFTRSDERELQALLETDPFRREAWEGFIALPGEQHGDYLNRLRERLRYKGGGHALPLGRWMAAAAALLVLLVAVYLMPRFSRDRSPAIAQSEQADHPGIPDGDSAMPENAQDITAAEPAAPVPPVSRSWQDNASSGQKGPPNVSEKPAEAAQSVLQEEPVASFSKPAPFDRLPARPADTSPVLVGGPEGISQNLVLNKPPMPPSGPADFANASPRAADSAARAAPARKAEAAQAEEAPETGKERSGIASDSTVQPEGGWEAFHLYMRQNARLTESARNRNRSGNVRLQFTIGPDGKPANVLVVRGLGFGCDEEAMRLIRLFDWTPTGAGPVLVEIPFVR